MRNARIRLANTQLKLVEYQLTHIRDAYPKDPNPENWRTISGAKVHLSKGKIDGGAGGKFTGKAWTSQKHPHKYDALQSAKSIVITTPEGVKLRYQQVGENTVRSGSGEFIEFKGGLAGIIRRAKEVGWNVEPEKPRETSNTPEPLPKGSGFAARQSRLMRTMARRRQRPRGSI